MRNVVLDAHRRSDIDGLRAVAVMAVIVFHLAPWRLPGGYTGVDVFFLISGFVITRGQIAAVRDGSFSWATFYFRRVRRIFPALLLVLLASAVGGWVLLRPAALVSLGTHILSMAVFVPNLLLWSEAGYFDASSETKPLLHLWSLGIEEQFYLLWPVVMMFLGRTRWLAAGLIALSLASFAYSVYAVDADPVAAFYSPISRLWELGLGCILAVLERPRSDVGQLATLQLSALSILGLVLIFLAFLTFQPNSAFPGWGALLPVLGAALVIAGGGPVNRIVLGNPIAVYVGLISYPLYLWHWPLIVYFQMALGALTTPTRILIFGEAFVLAALTYRFIERPISKMRSIRAVSTSALAGMAFAGSAGLWLYAVNGAPFRFPAEIQPIIAYESYDPKKDARYPACWISAQSDFASIARECYLQPAGSARSVALWGDSHAARLYPGLKAVLGPDTFIEQFTRDSCPPILDINQKGCERGNESILNQLRQSPPTAVILFGAWENYGYDWKMNSDLGAKLGSTIDELKHLGIAEVIVIGPTPRFDPFLPELEFRLWEKEGHTGRFFPDRLIEGVSTKTRQIDSDLSSTALGHGAVFASPYVFLCNTLGCLTHAEDSRTDLITYDYGHLTTSGAIVVANYLIGAGLLPPSKDLPKHI